VPISPGRVALVSSELDAYDAILIAERDEERQPDQIAEAV
jgi:hypothetical protein